MPWSHKGPVKPPCNMCLRPQNFCKAFKPLYTEGRRLRQDLTGAQRPYATLTQVSTKHWYQRFLIHNFKQQYGTNTEYKNICGRFHWRINLLYLLHTSYIFYIFFWIDPPSVWQPITVLYKGTDGSSIVTHAYTQSALYISKSSYQNQYSGWDFCHLWQQIWYSLTLYVEERTKIFNKNWGLHLGFIPSLDNQSTKYNTTIY